MTEPYDEIRDILQAVVLGDVLRRSWFRGHQEAVNKLTPRFYRKYSESFTTINPQREMELIEAFKRNAPAISDLQRLPEDDDTLRWLYLMQHYEAPTRLLDWTENVLAALYFAVSDEKKWGEVDGELWALNPFVLNKKSKVGESLPLPGRNPVIEYMAREPYWRKRQDLADTLAEKYQGRTSVEWMEDPAPFDRPVGFRPRRDFERMRVQSSVFTIHPRTEYDEPIPEILTHEKHLVRYIIPKDVKQKLWGQLKALEVTRQTLFPDFEGLSRTISPPAETVLYGEYPEPPTFETDGDAAD